MPFELVKPNGWQRLWVVLTCIWVAFWLVGGIFYPSANIRAVIAFAVIPPVFLYAAGLAVARTWRMFQQFRT